MQSGTYDPHAYAIGAGALFAGACAIIAFLLMRRRINKIKTRVFEQRIERNYPTSIGECAEGEDEARAAFFWKRKAT